MTDLSTSDNFMNRIKIIYMLFFPFSPRGAVFVPMAGAKGFKNELIFDNDKVKIFQTHFFL